MKNRILKFISACLSVLMIFSCFSVMACSKENDPPIIFNHVKDSTIELYETVKIDLREFVDQSAIVWESDNEDVAIINDGYVIGLSTGETTIKATLGEEEQEQTINVVDNGTRPVISIDNFSILNGETVALSPIATFKGVKLEGVTFTFSSKDSAIASIDNNTVVAETIGATEITITASWQGMNVQTKTIECSVNGDTGIGVGKHAYSLYVSDNVNGVSFSMQEVVTSKVNVNGQTIDGAIVSWVSGNEEIATIDQNAVLSAVGVGETYIQGTFVNDDVTIKTSKIPVIVNIPILETKDYLIVDLSTDSTTQTVTSSEVFTQGEHQVGKIVDADDGKIYSEDGVLKLDQFTTGEYRCIVYNNQNTVGVLLEFVVADLIVRTTQDFDIIGKKENLDKYIVIANDLDYTNGGPDGKGAYVTHGSHTDIENYFTGTINGLGHSITNLSMKNSVGGLFKGSRGGTFKNFAMEVKLSRGNQAALFYYFRESPTIIDNVYLDVTITGSSAEGGSYRPYDSNGNLASTGSAAICTHGLNSNISLRNTILRVENAGDEGLKDLCGAVMSYTGYGTAIFESCYVLTDDFRISGISNHPQNRFEEQINRTPNVIFENEQAFVAAKNREDSVVDLSGFNHYWDLSGDVPIFKTFNK